MDLERRPRYPEQDFGNEYELIENLLSGRQSCNERAGKSCPWNNGNGGCDVPELGSGVALAMVYSPMQYFDGLYDPMSGLEAGTIFKELDKPFMGRSVWGGKGKW